MDEDFEAKAAEFKARLLRACATVEAEWKARRQGLGDLADYLGGQIAANPEARQHHELVLTMIREFDHPSERRWSMRMAGDHGSSP